MSLTHFDEKTGRAKMVDVSAKEETLRVAIARGKVKISAELAELLDSGGLKKGDAFTVAKVAGILAAKRTDELIPMCHPLPLDHVDIKIELLKKERIVKIEASAKTASRTGVEMEAITAVSVAALTIYDMCKAVDKKMIIYDVGLYRKEGGKSGLILNEELED